MVTDTTTLDAESKLVGFTVGDEATVDVLKISQVKQQSRALAQDLECLQPIQHRHVLITQHQIGPALLDEADRLRAVLHLAHAQVPHPFEGPAQHLACRL